MLDRLSIVIDISFCRSSAITSQSTSIDLGATVPDEHRDRLVKNCWTLIVDNSSFDFQNRGTGANRNCASYDIGSEEPIGG